MSDLIGDVAGEEAASVRPYAVTGGRTRPTSDPLPFEALVEALGEPNVSMGSQLRQILDLTTGSYLSIAELSAHTHLPIGVVRILVGDLSDDGLVRIHGLTSGPAAGDAATTLSLLESVLNGISAL